VKTSTFDNQRAPIYDVLIFFIVYFIFIYQIAKQFFFQFCR